MEIIHTCVYKYIVIFQRIYEALNNDETLEIEWKCGPRKAPEDERKELEKLKAAEASKNTVVAQTEER